MISFTKMTTEEEIVFYSFLQDWCGKVLWRLGFNEALISREINIGERFVISLKSENLELSEYQCIADWWEFKNGEDYFAIYIRTTETQKFISQYFPLIYLNGERTDHRFRIAKISVFGRYTEIDSTKVQNVLIFEHDSENKLLLWINLGRIGFMLVDKIKDINLILENVGKKDGLILFKEFFLTNTQSP